MTETCQELMAINQSIKLMTYRDWFPMDLYSDNKAAISWAKPEGNYKLRHMIERKEHYVKECTNLNLIKPNWVPSNKQITDIFTKALTFEIRQYLTNIIMNN